MGCNVLAFAYRGYSDSTLSTGFPSEVTLKQDAQAILDYVKSMKDAEPIFIIGRSLGGAVASYMVSLDETPFEGLILENTFTSIADMVDRIFYFVGYVKWLIVRIGWDTR